ncbi:MAG: hypothetical protein RAP41_04050 [Candidatus Orphnella occulta]|nr:hypothetical protein [Candidatus Orphnella occulta]MDP8297337.1 hypothetical protein [Candidatus Orphnella occulta]
MKPISKIKRTKPKAIKKAPNKKSIDQNIIQDVDFAQNPLN